MKVRKPSLFVQTKFSAYDLLALFETIYLAIQRKTYYLIKGRLHQIFSH